MDDRRNQRQRELGDNRRDNPSDRSCVAVPADTSRIFDACSARDIDLAEKNFGNKFRRYSRAEISAHIIALILLTDQEFQDISICLGPFENIQRAHPYLSMCYKRTTYNIPFLLEDI